MKNPSQEQFVAALADAFREAPYPGLEWKYVEWVRDPCCKKLGITKLDFNDYLERALEDSDEGRIPWDILVDNEVGPTRKAQVRRVTPVMVCGSRAYILYMKPIEPEQPYPFRSSSTATG